MKTDEFVKQINSLRLQNKNKWYTYQGKRKKPKQKQEPQMNANLYHKLSSDQFYKLGGFANPALFRNDSGHYLIKDHPNYNQCLEQLKNAKVSKTN